MLVDTAIRSRYVPRFVRGASALPSSRRQKTCSVGQCCSAVTPGLHSAAQTKRCANGPRDNAIIETAQVGQTETQCSFPAARANRPRIRLRGGVFGTEVRISPQMPGRLSERCREKANSLIERVSK